MDNDRHVSIRQYEQAARRLYGIPTNDSPPGMSVGSYVARRGGGGRFVWHLNKKYWVSTTYAQMEIVDTPFRQTTCRWCGLDVEGSPNEGWRDRGGNIHCNSTTFHTHEGVM